MNEPSPTTERRVRLADRLPRHVLKRRVLTLGLARDDGLPGVSATVRLDRRTKNLTKRLQPGEIAVIDHVDLDRVSAEALVACGVGAVVNVAPSISGRYPNLGPQILLDADIPLVDDVGPEIFTRLQEGDQVRVRGRVVHKVTNKGEDVVAKGTEQTPESVLAALADAKAGLATQLEAFVANTMEYIKRERDLLIDGVGVPDVTTKLAGRHALIVVRGYHYREDIATLRPYIREYRPVLIGVDGGADALMEAGYRPDMIVGDMDSVSDDALTCGAEIVVHAYRDGRAPGLKRVHDLGQEAVTFPATATSEDIAMLLADDKGATLIVAVGTHANMVEFLDKGRAGMASTFLTRLRVGSKLVDAKGVSRLYRSRISTWSLLFLVLGAVVAIVTAVAMSPAGDVISPLLADRWHAFVFWLTGLFT
ncbi:putative membrane-anchored protein [Actinomadura pelletieri DSM 43383]|uniref:Putative membrane-anchored protein n=1 Tax=Actinomadura pelletieri DSM 43383 TaxID=1120940 RepID=A0A495QL43_9ACTN|nr:putative cytokinetic ring protein SteA [Actinomadura pelletieri]RKS73243.1 putative membrane-anchored protein [Actinomadura pelletieri DSM 43383]